MQHILNIAFDFDDEVIKKRAENAVNNEMTAIVREIATDAIAPMSSGWYGKQERDWSALWRHIDLAIDKIIEDNREEIIEKAAEKLVKSAKATKAWKSKFSEIMESE